MNSESSVRSRYRLLPFLIFAMGAVALATWMGLASAMKDRILSSTGEGLAMAASDIADKLDLFWFERYADSKILSSTASLQRDDPSRLSAHLQKVREAYKVYHWVAIADAQGRIVSATDPAMIGTDQSTTAWFISARDAEGVYASDAELAEGRDQSVVFANSIKDPAGKFVGVAVIHSSLPTMDSLFENTTRSLQWHTAGKAQIDWQVTTRTGSLIHDSRKEAAASKSTTTIPANLRGDGPGWREAIDPVRNRPAIFGFASTRGREGFQGLGWKVIVEADRESVLHSMHRNLWKVAAGSFAILLPIFWLAAWSARRLRRDWARATASEAYLRTTLQSMGEGVVITDASGQVTMFNQVAQNLTGLKESDAIGRDAREVICAVNRHTREPMDSLVREVLRDAQPTAREEYALLVSRDGTERIISQSAAPIIERGKIVGTALICHDVTQRELAETALRASQETFHIITENMSDIVTLHKLDGRAVFQSRNRIGEVDLLDPRWQSEPFGYVIAEDRPTLMECFRNIIKSGEPQSAEYRVKNGGEKMIVVESIGTLIRRPDGSPDRILAVSRDITERRRTAEKLRSEKEFTDSLLASLPGVFFVCNSERHLLRWNRNFEIVVGYSASEIAEVDFLSFFPVHDHPQVQQRLELCLEEGKCDIETCIHHRNGRVSAHYISGLRIEVDGQPAMLGVGIDISARKAAEEALRAASNRLERQNIALAKQARNPLLRGEVLEVAFQSITEVAAQTLGVSRVGIWFYDSEKRSIRCEDLYDSPSGRHSRGSFMHEPEYPRYFAALKEGRVIPIHYARTDPRSRDFADSYLKPLGVTSLLDAPIRIEGQMIGVICHEHTGSPREWTLDEQNFAASMADLVAISVGASQRRKAEQAVRDARDQLEVKVADRTRELSEANDRLKELDRLKSEFLATMSHELRTPMNSIIGFTGILRQELAGPLNDEQKKQLGMVNFSAKHLLTLINDLLDLSRIESGKMEVHNEPFAVAPLLSDVIESLTPIVQQKKMKMVSEIDSPDLEIVSDRKKVFQILLNLANNAVKFTDKGEVRVVVNVKSHLISFSVIDTGIGIKPEQLTNLFAAFRQVDGSAKRVYEGTGLGLYLSKKLVKLLNGTIGAESEFGVGSTFHFSIPRNPTTQTQ